MERNQLMNRFMSIVSLVLIKLQKYRLIRREVIKSYGMVFLLQNYKYGLEKRVNTFPKEKLRFG